MTMMTASRTLLLTALPLLVLACGQTDETSETTSALTEPAGDRSGGPAKFLAQALQKLDLSADQRTTLDALTKATRTKTAPLREAGATAAKELARQIRLGAIDKVSLDRQLALLSSAAQQVKPDIIRTFNTLHHTLTPAQREQLVATLKEKHDKRRWGHRRHKIKRLAKMIGLTDDQMDRLKEVMMAGFKGHRSEMKKHRSDHRARIKAAAEGFMSDSFDSSSFDMFGGHATRMQTHLPRFVAIAGQVLPLLTTEQRDKLAEMIEKKIARMGHTW